MKTGGFELVHEARTPGALTEIDVITPFEGRPIVQSGRGTTCVVRHGSARSVVAAKARNADRRVAIYRKDTPEGPLFRTELVK